MQRAVGNKVLNREILCNLSEPGTVMWVLKLVGSVMLLLPHRVAQQVCLNYWVCLLKWVCICRSVCSRKCERRGCKRVHLALVLP